MAFTFTDENVNEIIESGKPVMIDIWGTYCAPCIAMAPLIDELAAEYEGRVVIGKYNVDDEGDLCTTYRVMACAHFPLLQERPKGKHPSLRFTDPRDSRCKARRAPRPLIPQCAGGCVKKLFMPRL